MDLLSSTIWYWVILAVTGIVSGVLGYVFGKSDTSSSSDKSIELNILEIENAKLKSDLETCRKRLDSDHTKSFKFDSKIKFTKNEDFVFTRIRF